MKRKYFLFRKEDLSLLSSSSSDTGQGLSVFGVSADLMSYITASKGGVTLYFNDATPYEENNLTNGESFEKTFVTVSCEEGKEVDLIESIMKFLGSESSPTVMRFDSIDQTSNVKEVKTSVEVGASLKTHPINRVTGDVSFQADNGFTADTSNVINDIDFFAESNKPILDLEGENATYDSGSPFDITAWANSGTGSTSFNVNASACVGTITNAAAGASTGLSKNSPNIGLDAYAVLTNTLTVKNDYTLYVVYSPNIGVTDAHGSLYGSTSGESVGLNIISEDAVKSTHANSTIGLRHEDRTGLPAIAKTNTLDAGTVAYKYPVLDSSSSDYQQCYVFVIRRDKKNNIYVYNHNGDAVATLSQPAKLKSTLGTAFPGDTEGDLVINQIGSAGGNTTNSFKGRIARFGVIEKDVGDSVCRKLAKDLFNLYKF